VPFNNILLNQLSPDDLALIEPALEPFRLRAHDVLVPAGGRIEHVYFVEDGLLSLVSEYEPGREIEVGMIGREGYCDVGTALGDELAVFKVNVQSEGGSSFRLPAATLRDTMARSRAFHDLMLRFARSLEIQIASTASSNGRAKLEERLARWLLMVHDRLDTDIFHITHEFLAQMLCCRRPGVTVALHLLEGKGLIRSTRGQVDILDRGGLEVEANGGYGKAELQYERLMDENLRSRRRSFTGAAARMHLSLVPSQPPRES
jgi:CRP-like cAMP-binding protein